MIRVIYRWRVNPEDFDAFCQAWSATTNKIHETVPGALGSFMLQEEGDSSDILTIAKWDSITSWKAFWGEARPVEMETMQQLGERVSVHAYREVDDFTR